MVASVEIENVDDGTADIVVDVVFARADAALLVVIDFVAVPTVMLENGMTAVVD